jgi:glucokinase
MAQPLVLVGDIGGTKTSLALFSLAERSSREHFVPLYPMVYPSKRYDTLEPMVREYLAWVHGRLAGDPNIVGATFGVAGPVVGRICRTTNLPWIVDAESLERLVSVPEGSVFLLNDLESLAWSVGGDPLIPLATVQDGEAGLPGTRVLVAPGTGLGEAVLCSRDGDFFAIPSEGGHADWAPFNKEQSRILDYLWEEFHHVSVERLLSGMGIVRLYSYLAKDIPSGSRPLPIPEGDPPSDLPAQISHKAIDEKNPVCLKALELFVEILAQEASNMVLKVLARGGCFLGGGIPIRIRPLLESGIFRRRFVEKGRYSELLAKVPVWIILDPEAPLVGSAFYASRHVLSYGGKMA